MSRKASFLSLHRAIKSKTFKNCRSVAIFALHRDKGKSAHSATAVSAAVGGTGASAGGATASTQKISTPATTAMKARMTPKGTSSMKVEAHNPDWGSLQRTPSRRLGGVGTPVGDRRVGRVGMVSLHERRAAHVHRCNHFERCLIMMEIFLVYNVWFSCSQASWDNIELPINFNCGELPVLDFLLCMLHRCSN